MPVLDYIVGFLLGSSMTIMVIADINFSIKSLDLVYIGLLGGLFGIIMALVVYRMEKS